MIAIVVMTDGRRMCIEQTIAAAETTMNLDPMLRIVHDDSGDADYHHWLVEKFAPRWSIFWTPQRSGFGGAIRSAWDHLRSLHGITHIFHLEDDFVMLDTVPLYKMIDLLDDRPEVVQVALVRQPWNVHERTAGGMLQRHRENLAQMHTKFDEPYVAQRVFFTTNPSLYRRSLLDEGWPEGSESEGHFFHQLLRTGTNGVPGNMLQFAYWGEIDDPPRVTHIGEHRVGNGY